ncbi:MAG: glycosyltransferase family 4 protein [Candidatus Omnitrophica bacterium]|nr:glycosyltransferase family 4 protein [Candidatus Omnitrophota bacterium]MBU1922951.1 glycosyltransferase family 4 protein [Candidatus Omnitrophota bacterium]
MKICIIGKYPPIEGGVSTYTYWLAKALGENGNRVFVVTNANEAGFEYREDILPKEAHKLEPKGVKVYNTSPLNRKFIPSYSPFVATLAGLAIEIVRKEKIDAIYSNYLMPYGIAAYIVKQATGVPWFLDHAGSDITNLFDEPLLNPVFVDLFKKADMVANSRHVYKKLVKPGFIPTYAIAPLSKKEVHYNKIINIHRDFSPESHSLNLFPHFRRFNKKLPVFTFIGKISELKKTFNFVEAASKLPRGKFYLLFITEKGLNLIKLRNFISRYDLTEYSCFLPFQPPWKMPQFICASTCIVAPESQEMPYLPIGTHFSRISLEAMACGRCVLLGEGMAKKGLYSQYKDGKQFLLVDPQDIEDFARKMLRIINHPSLAYKIGKEARMSVEKQFHGLYTESVKGFIKILYATVLKAKA